MLPGERRLGMTDKQKLNKIRQIIISYGGKETSARNMFDLITKIADVADIGVKQ